MGQLFFQITVPTWARPKATVLAKLELSKPAASHGKAETV